MITLITGMGRCGLSLVMQMLDAGGFPVHDYPHGFPGYEDPRWCGLPRQWSWLQEADGKALKALDVHRYTPPAGEFEYRAVHLTRDHREQAKSALKLNEMLHPGLHFKMGDAERYAKGLKQEQARFNDALHSLVGPGDERLMELTFEHLLMLPEKSAYQIANFLERTGGPALDDAAIQRMAEAVMPRGAGSLCLSDGRPVLLETLQLEMGRETWWEACREARQMEDAPAEVAEVAA